MATTLYMLNLDNVDAHMGHNAVALRTGAANAWETHALGTTRGGAGGGSANYTYITADGPVSGLEVHSPNGNATPAEWISPPVSADVTISGTITANIWASESAMNANVAINVVIDLVRATDNSIVNIVQSTRTTEVSTSSGVNNFTTGMTSGAYTPQTLNRGDRLRVRIIGTDAGTMASGFTFNATCGGTTAGASGDTFVTFTETFSFESAPSGTTLYLTDSSPTGVSNYPQIADVQSGNVTSASATWALSYPADLQEGDLIIAIIARDANVTTTFPAEFETTISETTHTEAKTVALGTETGTFDVTLGSARVGSWAVYRITNWHGTLGTAFDNSTPGGGDVPTNSAVTGTSTAPNAQSLDPANWAAGESTLWMTFVVALANPTAYPYTDNQLELNRLMVCTTQNTSGSEDAPAWTIDASVFWAARTIAIRGVTTTRREAWTSRGAGVTSAVVATANGFTAPIQWTTASSGGTALEWFTKPLTAFTLGGMTEAHIRCRESSSSANASFRLEIAVTDGDCANPVVWGSWCNAARTVSLNPVTELDETAEAEHLAWISGDDTSVADGQRLRIRLYIDDASGAALGTVGPMAAGFDCTLWYAGTTGGASGDTYIKLPQSVTEFTTGLAGVPITTGYARDRFGNYRR